MTNVPKKNLHLLADMGFADSFAERLEAFNLRDRNHIILVGKSPHKRLAKGAFPYTNLKDEHAPNPDEYNKVIVHFLLPMVCHWLKQHRELRIHWMFYGAEVYRNPLVGYDPIGPETKRYFSLNLDDLKRNVGYHLIHRRAWKKALLQVESILTHNPVEFELIKSLVAVPQAKMETFFYGKGLADAGPKPPVVPPSKQGPLSVQLGHCAFPSVNHMDFLKACAPQAGVEFHVPLSYGDSKYALWVKKQAQNRTDLHWMMHRLPIEAYMRHIDQMDAGVFPNARQQGLNNIKMFIRQGKPVFLHPDSPTTAYYKSIGIEVGRTDAFSVEEYHRLKSLAEQNKAAFSEYGGEAACREHYQRLFN